MPYQACRFLKRGVRGSHPLASKIAAIFPAGRNSGIGDVWEHIQCLLLSEFFPKGEFEF
jgi:hypothetical protein